MVGVENLEAEIVPLAARYGLKVYDIEVVAFGRATLRVFVEKDNAPAGVTVGQIESFAKVLIPYLNLKELFPREGHVEVSSPGLFRRLRRPEHFSSAVGQIVAVTAQDESGKQTVRAKLLSVAEDGITLESAVLPFATFSNILRARMEPEVKP